MLVAFVNFLCILPATALQFFYQSKAVTMKHPRCYVAAATAVSAAIWAVNNFLCSPPSAVLDTVQLFQCYVLAWLFAKRGEKGRALGTALVYMCVSILGNYLLALAAFPIRKRRILCRADPPVSGNIGRIERGPNDAVDRSGKPGGRFLLHVFVCALFDQGDPHAAPQTL